jgi:pyruvate kinase
VPYAIRKKDI